MNPERSESLKKSRGLLLVRHPQVEDRLHGVCYGRSDVGLSPQGRRQGLLLSQRLSQLPVKAIVHSGLQRTAWLAHRLAALTGLSAQREGALVERDFGSWELQTWDEIYQRDGDQMLKMISEPEDFRPGGGETTSELADRIDDWYRGWQVPGLTVAVTHGGPIAACLGRQRRLPVNEWMALVPACGAFVWIDHWHTLQRTSL